MSGNATNQALRPNRDKFCIRMLSLDDKRWQNLEGGYRTQFDGYQKGHERCVA
jgi:hypothetical protein